MGREQIRIYFRGEPFMARLWNRGTPQIQCTPVVWERGGGFGVAVLHREGGWGWDNVVFPRDFIAAWRATEFLRRLDVIEESSFCDAYYTGVRNRSSDLMKSCVQRMVALIGKKAYNRIMSLPVPEEIIRVILDGQETSQLLPVSWIDDDFVVKPDLSPITEEVRAGTLDWRQEFADAGVKYPDKGRLKKWITRLFILTERRKHG